MNVVLVRVSLNKSNYIWMRNWLENFNLILYELGMLVAHKLAYWLYSELLRRFLCLIRWRLFYLLGQSLWNKACYSNSSKITRANNLSQVIDSSYVHFSENFLNTFIRLVLLIIVIIVEMQFIGYFIFVLLLIAIVIWARVRPQKFSSWGLWLVIFLS